MIFYYFRNILLLICLIYINLSSGNSVNLTGKIYNSTECEIKWKNHNMSIHEYKPLKAPVLRRM
jgi:hypothetical protein